MRLLIFFLTLFSLNIISAQTWSYESGGNAFDGKYKVASVQGKGNDFPYNKPFLVINLFNENSLNFFITGAGYFSQSSDVEVLWIFNNEPDTIYATDDYSISNDGKTIFFSSFRNTITDDVLFKLEYIEKLKRAGKVEVRIKNDYGKNDIGFSLFGSTKAINYVISKKYKDKIKFEFELYKTELLEIIEKEIELNSRISKLLLEAEVLENEIEGVLDRIDNTFDLNMNDIVSLSFELNSYSINLNLFDSNKKLLKEISFIGRYMPKSYEKMKNKIESEKAKIMLEKQNRTEVLLKKVPSYFDYLDLSSEQENVIVDIVREQQKSLKLNLSNIDSISITSEFSSTKEFAKTHYWRKNAIITNSYARIPQNILEIIENKGEEKCSIKFLELIEKYGLTEEENNYILDKALVYIKIYFHYDIGLIEEINVKTSKDRNENIILEFIKNDGTREKEKTIYADNSMSRRIIRKIKKLK